MKTLPQTTLTWAMVLGFSGIIAVACANKRKASLPEDQVAGTFLVSELQDAQIKIKTREGKKSTVKNNAFLGSEQNTFIVDTQGVPERFLFLFRNLEVIGKQSAELDIVFGVDRAYVTAYKLSKKEDLTSLEKSLAFSEESLKSKINLKKLKTNQQLLVPLFKFKVTAHGTIEKVKNELKEETSVLKLKKSEWESSTHVQISDLSHERLSIETDPAVATESETYLITEKIQEKTFSKADLIELLGSEIPGNEATSYKLVVDSNSIKVFAAQEKPVAQKNPVVTLNAEQMEAQLNLEKGQETNIIAFKKTSADKLGTFTKIVKVTAAK